MNGHSGHEIPIMQQQHSKKELSVRIIPNKIKAYKYNRIEIAKQELVRRIYVSYNFGTRTLVRILFCEVKSRADGPVY
jgi:CRISPR/Cas system-associated protein Csx1